MIRRNPIPNFGKLILCSALLLAACAVDNAPSPERTVASTQPAAPPAPAAPSPSPPAPASPATVSPAPTTPEPPALPPPPADPSARRPGDLAPCPGINPDIRRPPGAKCLGIVPSQCSADRVGIFVGRSDSAALRRDLAAAASHDNIRWIRPGEAVIENLDPSRLNVALSAAGRIATVDCY